VIVSTAWSASTFALIVKVLWALACSVGVLPFPEYAQTRSTSSLSIRTRIHQRLGHSDQIPSQCCGTSSSTRTSEIVDIDALLGAELNGTTSWSTQGRCQLVPIQLSIAACPPGTGNKQRCLAPTPLHNEMRPRAPPCAHRCAYTAHPMCCK
jgi:hypothetical protein